MPMAEKRHNALLPSRQRPRIANGVTRRLMGGTINENDAVRENGRNGQVLLLCVSYCERYLLRNMSGMYCVARVKFGTIALI
jgi:hypothetical protein